MNRADWEDGTPLHEAQDAGVDPEADDGPPVPFICLGLTSDGIYYFFSHIGAYRQFRYNELTHNGLVSLMDGDMEWALKSFPGPKDSRRSAASFDIQAAVQWVVRKSAKAGHWDPNVPVRRAGVWLRSDGAILVHTGDRLMTVGEDLAGLTFEEEPAGRMYDRMVYPSGPTVEAPAQAPADIGAGERLLHLLEQWHWESEIGPELALGWIGQAMLGGAPRWRVHVMCTGPRGCGKSELVKVLEAVLGAAAHPVKNGYTEAHLRQSMTQGARAMILDEAEHDETGHQIAQIIKLLVLMSQGEGARIGRGSAGGEAREFSITGAAWLSSILHAELKPAARSRIQLVRLRPLPDGEGMGAAKQLIEAGIEAMAELSAAIRARAIAGWGRFQETYALYRGAFLDSGCDPRSADTIAVLLAGKDLLLHDHLPDSDTCAEAVERYAELIEYAQVQEDEGEGQECLNHLYSSPAILWRGGDPLTVGQAVAAALNEPSANDKHRRAIGAIGLRVVNADTYSHWVGEGADRESLFPTGADGAPKFGPILLVATNHDGLETIFAGTRWAKRAWSQALHHLPGGTRALVKGELVPRFGGARSRCTLLFDPKWHPLDEIKVADAAPNPEEEVQ